MFRHLRVFCLLAAVSLCVGAGAQYDAAFNHYWTLQSLYNPAASGLKGQLDVQAAYAMQMMGYTHAPATMTITADVPLWMISPAHGAGVGFVNDKIGLFEHKRFFIHYAYHQKLWGGRLSVGVRGGLLAESFDGTGVDVIETGDPAFPSSEVNGTVFDLDGGLRYDGRQWYAGFSVAHALAPMVSLGDAKVNEFEVPQTFYLTGGYNIRLRNPLLSMQTSAIVRTDLSAWRGDATVRLCYNGPKGKMYVGAGYSPTISASVLIGGDFHGIQLGYCYEIYTSGIGALQGTHELSIGYTTDLNLFKKGKNRHQSVRIL
ncbi:MAG: PorP/SprF family type IX secretion system membrane protein [Bacteroidaceae bacterium]|nr:PorP/SprF family type IX secretion system membrane protein [Bacteroidaceae bacterium]MBR0433465.1 PorP/SprF family type IX secretion system membrane protein [Bacteroidaceae bacterium]